ncbi:sensor histidine kinase [Mediterraneibacter agrestimuris]|uniref:sensor histidine kinase n=1 Tax=Mediterraneibacter agrestimuris TaxID=2941333 RepID=UPI00203AE85A|nr:sensor histidine kinase [Mediterraneibacter agrestimuris]
MDAKSPKQLYNKLLLIYTTILAFVVMVLMIYFLSSTRNRFLEQNLEYTKMMNEEAVSYLEETSAIAGRIHENLYQSEMELQDLLHYLSDTAEDYWKYRLDTYMESGTRNYKGADGFLTGVLASYDELKSVTLLSYERGEVTEYAGKGGLRKSGRLLTSKIEQEDLADAGEFSYLKEIRDPVTMQTKGCMLLTFDGKKFEQIQQYYSRAELFVCNGAGTIVFDSARKESVRDILYTGNMDMLETKLNAYVETSKTGGYFTLCYLEKKKAAVVPASIMVMIFLVGIGAMVVGETCVQYYLKRLSTRLNRILDGMNRVMEGDLSVRLSADKKNGDELDVISRHFNEMCIRLDEHIQKQYLAEIEQKNAEMSALQSQINPHFLYNTLEAIRMKAICNGDREVGKMLYSMAVTFRSQIKEADVITMAQELHYCKKYMELFEFRYQNQFNSSVECPEEYMAVPIIKFVLQPVIENYFIHGIRMEDKDNFIRIYVEKDKDVYRIVVEDNGRGMPEDEIRIKNKELAEGVMKKQSSIGVANVNRRLKAVYGKEYGVYMESRPKGGLKVILCFKPEEEGMEVYGNSSAQDFALTAKSVK